MTSFLPATMKAWVLTKFGPTASGFELRNLPVPVPGQGEVLVKVSHAGLNFADVMAMLGLYRDAPPLPAVLGYDVAGTVAAVGPKVTAWKPGDRVFGLSRFGGFAEYALTSELALAALPDGISPGVGAALATQGLTAQYMAHYLQPLRAGEQVLVHAAAGGVGTLLVQLAKAAGCFVYGTAGSAEKLRYLDSLGVDVLINYREQPFWESIAPNSLDVIFDPVGGTSLRKGMGLLRPGGRMIAFGGSSFVDATSFFAKLANFLRFGFYHPMILVGGSRSLVGVNMLRLADHRPEVIRQVLAETAASASTGLLKPTIDSTFDATEFPAAIERLRSRASIGKILLTWNAPS